MSKNRHAKKMAFHHEVHTNRLCNKSLTKLTESTERFNGIGFLIELVDSGTIKIKAQAIEYDKITDVGSSQKIIKVSSLSNKAIEFTLKVTVTKNSGRYSSNQAQWKFVFLIKKE